MKITESQLRRIIRQEVRTLREGRRDELGRHILGMDRSMRSLRSKLSRHAHVAQNIARNVKTLKDFVVHPSMELVDDLDDRGMTAADVKDVWIEGDELYIKFGVRSGGHVTHEYIADL